MRKEAFRDLVEQLDELWEEIRRAEERAGAVLDGINEPLKDLNRWVRRARQLRREIIRRCDQALVDHTDHWKKGDRGSSVADLRQIAVEMDLEDRYVILALDVSDRLEALRILMETGE